MAPPRQRTTVVQDDSRSEGSSTAREQKPTTAKGRKANTSLAAAAREAKAAANVTSAPAGGNSIEAELDSQPKMHWPEMPLEILHSYRHAYKISSPSAFASEYSRLLLSRGIGLRSPTSIAAQRAHDQKANGSEKKPDSGAAPTANGTAKTSGNRHHHNRRNYRPHGPIDGKSALNHIIGQDRVSKNQLAATVRKHFNSAGLAEQEAIARFLYKVREEGRGRHFRLRFQP